MAIGNKLRQARENLSLTLEDIESATKIRRKYLEALENEQFGILPGRVYARCFLNTYARFLGLNTKEIIQKYDRIFPPETDGETETAGPGRLKPKKSYTTPKIDTCDRLTANRDAHLVAQIRKALAEKKKQPWWERPVIRLLVKLR
ncbi:MAG: helix-turn-helix domain-containing protein [Pelotomaculum sp.]|nr:helix-turn-helix domain-containing protein [Pelotomaculum sp.]